MKAKSTIKIYHNEMCSKSCAALQLLDKNGVNPEIVSYLDGTLDTEELKNILTLLKLKPYDLIRTNEPLFQEQYKNMVASDEQWIEIMLQHPILIERPIVIRDNQAIIGRPIERLVDLLKETS
ncbi:arsenate reductase [Sphingobacterium nematocida]|uniref:Arsenate reductase n=1 Tax=Sphingobacterium nematocida TaxID=1513896 RepID=A0A1T5FUW9_9SPHI|nr:arsenate reductase (glutaredoxin) [Sphingobacterium nematocida]SKB99956.1 arsenate reductase [Sphingobacterium nematocida]